MRALMATEPGGDEVMAASDDYITKGELITSLHKLDLMCCVASLAAVRLAASGIATVS